MRLTAPPLLKTTIIQLNKDIDPEDNNYEILTNGYGDNTNREMVPTISYADEQPRKKRRRLSSLVDEEELAKRRHETKQLHSVIEKRRRIKINREFEALKYLIPACRSADTGKRLGTGNNNGAKIDGMYKLTILKAAVEYILYLHHVVKEQHDALSQVLDEYDYDVGFCDAALDVNQYRNIDHDFDFSELAMTAPMVRTTSLLRSRCETVAEVNEFEHNEGRQVRAKSDTAAFIAHKSQKALLPTPDVTPDMAPIFTLLAESEANGGASSRDNLLSTRAFLFESSSRGSVSSNTSPFTVPNKSLVKSTFHLPDAALASAATGPASVAGPRKMFFKTKVPATNTIQHVGDTEEVEPSRVEDATRALLTLRKPSIDNLLN